MPDERSGSADRPPPGADEPGDPDETGATGDDRETTPQGPDSDVRSPDELGSQRADPDVLLDVPKVSVDEIDLEVENLRARVSLNAEVLDLVKLNVGADVELGRVSLTISGVEAEAMLKVRLDTVARILERVLSTIDRNPQILEQVVRSVEPVVRGAGQAAEQLGEGAGQAVEQIGGGTGQAVQHVGRGAEDAVEEAGRGAGQAVRDVGQGAHEVTGQAAEATGDLGESASRAVGDTTRSAARSEGGEPEQDGTEQDDDERDTSPPRERRRAGRLRRDEGSGRTEGRRPRRDGPPRGRRERPT